MRIAIMAAAFGLVLGAPVLAPTSFMEVAVAQTSAETALQNELIAAANDPAALQAIIDRETAAGNTDGLASALISAARTLVVSDTTGGAALAIAAVKASDGASEDVQTEVGEGASDVATTAQENGDAVAAQNLEVEVATSVSVDVQMGYVDAGGTAGDNLGSAPQADDQGGGNQQGAQPGGDEQGGDQQGDQQSGGEPGSSNAPAGPTVSAGPPPRPPSIVVVVPVVVEPNPAQAGSPT